MLSVEINEALYQSCGMQRSACSATSHPFRVNIVLGVDGHGGDTLPVTCDL
ncbi:hypothetical protein OG493_18685 [Streptomyces sp. NBC_01285]|nr:hypothetical protein [Streptomyces sp. NBC_01285]